MRQPTLLLKPSAFKNGKLYAQLPDTGNGDFTVTTPDNGTRVNSQGLIEAVSTNQARIDYLDAPGLLLEPTRTNLWQESEDFSLWTTNNGTLTANDTVAPDGEYTATKIAAESETTVAAPFEDYAVSDATAIHTGSIFVKPGNADFLVGFGGAGSVTQTAFLSITKEGVVTASTDSNGIRSDWGYENYKDGWIRVWTTYDTNDANTNTRITIYPAPAFAISTGYMWAWGAQVEEGYFPTSYIPTSGGTLARSADSSTRASIETNGIIDDSRGAFLIDVDVTDKQPDSSLFLVSVGTATNTRFGLIVYTTITNATYSRFYVDGASDALTDISGGRNKILVNLFGTDVDVWVNGTKAIETTNDLNISLDTITLGSGSTGGKGKLRELAIWDTPLTDTEAQALTR